MINVITFSSLLANNLTTKVMVKFQQSVDDFLNRASNTHRQQIHYLSYQGKTLTHSEAPTYRDGTLKNPTNYWDLLNQDEKEEAIPLMDLRQIRLQEIREIRKYLTSLAQKCIQLNNFNEIVSYELDSYLKFFNCLPDFITQDRELLTTAGKSFQLTENDLYDIEQYGLTTKVDTDFVNKHRNKEVDKILASLYALDFLVDF